MICPKCATDIKVVQVYHVYKMLHNVLDDREVANAENGCIDQFVDEILCPECSEDIAYYVIHPFDYIK